MANVNRDGRTRGTGGAITDDWAVEEAWWRENYASRPYVRADLPFDFYSPAFRYGYESANRYRGRKWEEVESELEGGWDSVRGSSRSTWQEIKDAVKDAWNHITGDEHGRHAGDSRDTVNPDVRF
jgi:hypothetical protein